MIELIEKIVQQYFFLYLSEPPYTFKDRDEAFKVLKKNRESRLKCFKTPEEAEFFSLNGHENSNGTPPGNSIDASNGVDLSENDPKGKMLMLSIPNLYVFVIYFLFHHKTN